MLLLSYHFTGSILANAIVDIGEANFAINSVIKDHIVAFNILRLNSDIKIYPIRALPNFVLRVKKDKIIEKNKVVKKPIQGNK